MRDLSGRRLFVEAILTTPNHSYQVLRYVLVIVHLGETLGSLLVDQQHLGLTVYELLLMSGCSSLRGRNRRGGWSDGEDGFEWATVPF